MKLPTTLSGTVALTLAIAPWTACASSAPAPLPSPAVAALPASPRTAPFVLVHAPAADAAPSDPAKLEQVRTLLRRLHREHLSSLVTLDREPTATDLLRAEHPAAALVCLQQQGDATVFDLGGTFYATLANDLGIATRLKPTLCDLLTAHDPRHVAFACEALGCLGWADAAVHLRLLVEDQTVVPGYQHAVVADFARAAVRHLGGPDDGRR